MSKKVKIQVYTPTYRKEWDWFVGKCKKSHFMFFRDYMDYHKDRFTDFSLLIRDESERLIAVMPANIRENNLFSHQGLTFGGFLYDKKLRTGDIVDIVEAVKEFLVKEGVKSLIYKSVPYIYQSVPSDEDLYALFYHGARLVRRDVSVAIFQEHRLKYSTLRRRMIKKAAKKGLDIEESNNFTEFWEVLTKVLAERHGARPTHTLDEISLLKRRFPKNIRLFQVRLNGEVIAGTVVYETEYVAHTQYLANSSIGREIGALDYLIDHLINEVYKSKRYFDFGISTENEGRILNRGLIAQKEGFGARAVVHDFYEWDLTQE